MAWEKLGSASVTGTTANTSWKELGRFTATSGTDTLDTGTFTAKDNMMCLSHQTGGQYNMWRFNNVSTGTPYAVRHSDNGGSDGTITSKNELLGYDNTCFQVMEIVNNSSQEKLAVQHCVGQNTAGAGNAPNRREIVGKWADTSNQINRVQLVNEWSGSTGSGDFASGSEVVVLGYDNDEADSGTNFWQELASVELSSTGSSIDSGTFTAKKYLMFEAYYDFESGANDAYYQFNGDTGSNYAWRRNINGGSDVSYGSQTYLRNTVGVNDPKYDNGYIVNKSDKEKLMISWNMEQGGSGATNAPSREEWASKWANTSSQITQIELNMQTGNFSSGSYLKVYGAD